MYDKTKYTTPENPTSHALPVIMIHILTQSFFFNTPVVEEEMGLSTILFLKLDANTPGLDRLIIINSM
jgi:hypothetical protein